MKKYDDYERDYINDWFKIRVSGYYIGLVIMLGILIGSILFYVCTPFGQNCIKQVVEAFQEVV